jgi:hypothetical protein
LQANGGIFRPQGAAIYAVAADDVRVLVLVLGKPANTNALIAAAHAPDAPADRSTAMMRLDHNRALTQIAKRLDLPVSDIHRMTIWGNHSASQYPDLYHARANGRSVAEQVDEAWLRETPIPTRGQTAVRFPVTSTNGTWRIVQGLSIDPFSRGNRSTPPSPKWPRNAPGHRTRPHKLLPTWVSHLDSQLRGVLPVVLNTGTTGFGR